MSQQTLSKRKLTRSRLGSLACAPTDYNPRSNDELLALCVNNPLWFLENCLLIRGKNGGIIPFRLNSMQLAYYGRIWLPRLPRDVQPKARKYGFTTLRIALGLHETLYTPGPVFRAFFLDKHDAGE